MSLWDRLSAAQLRWLPDRGIGYFEGRGFVYGRQYFENYLGYDSSPTGDTLTRARVTFVRNHWNGKVLDVGIGGGRFVTEIDGIGHDINPHALRWLREQGRSWDGSAVEAACFWDSLEHMRNPDEFLVNVRSWAFISIPIFRDAAHARASKHFKPDEHYWYFTRAGLVGFMAAQGFEVRAHSAVEQECGREDIETFAFFRRL